MRAASGGMALADPPPDQPRDPSSKGMPMSPWPLTPNRPDGRRRPSILPSPALGLLLVLACSPLAADDAAEAERIVQALQLRAGEAVADVGAGEGEWVVPLARRVGPEGEAFATEVAEEELEAIRDRLSAEGLEWVRVVKGDQQTTGLPDGCCDAVLLRMVYHHFTDPPAMQASLRRALRPGGRLMIIDIEPQKHWRHLEGVPERGGHGISEEDLVAELEAAGFEVLSRHPDWNDDADRFAVVFRRR